MFAPFKYDNDTRCDLHPRWNHKGDNVCFDSVFEGHRGLYVVDVSELLPSGISETNETNTARVDKAVPKYSIVTPMYNSFHLMERYFKSLEHQTLKDFEVILVDDCSTDGSYEKACEYAGETSLKLSIYQTEKNGGPGNARNIGMDKACGEWLTFIDNDDWVDTGMMEKVDRVIRNYKVNCVIYDYYITDGKEHRVARSMYSGEKGIISLTKCMASVRNHTIGKFYKLTNCREKEIRFPELRRCEDVAFVCRAIDACGSVYYMKEPMYYYFQRPSSLSNNQSLDETDMIKAFGILEKSLGGKYPEEMKEKSVSDLLYGVLLMMCKSGKEDREINLYIDNYEEKYPEWWNCESMQFLGKAKQAFLLAARARKPFLMKQYANLHGFLIGGRERKS